MSYRRPTLVEAALAVVLTAIGSVACRRVGPDSVPQPDAAAPGQQIDRIIVDARPPLVLVAREGDPRGAVALALAHDLGSQASVALASLLVERLQRRGVTGLKVDAHGLGLEISALVASPKSIDAFLVELSSALKARTAPTEAERSAIARALKELAARAWAGPAQAQIAGCSGDLGVRPTDRPVVPSDIQLERWRAAVFSTRAARFAVVGPTLVLRQAAESLQELPDWPDSTAPNDPWPDSDAIGVDPIPHGREHLALALRVEDPRRALAAGRELVRPGSRLRTRLRLIAPQWSVARVVGTSRPRGACLRVDLAGPVGGRHFDVTAMGQLAQSGLDELEDALMANRPTDPAATDSDPLQSPDPRQAAAIAAWRALSDQRTAGALRRYVALSTTAPVQAARASDSLRAELLEAERASKRSSLQLVERTERGQAQIWALVACPCPGSLEGPDNAGAMAVAVTALTTAQPRLGSVSIEPWISSQGVGVVAHGPRSYPGESPSSHARRIGDALGRVLAHAPVMSSGSFLLARDRLVEQVGPGPRPGWWLLLDALAPGHPELLETRGSWSTLADLTLENVRAHAYLFLTGPLRLAVLTNTDDTQASHLRTALQRWIQPINRHGARCSRQQAPEAVAGVRRLKVAVSAGAEPVAYVGVRVPQEHADAARWTTWLLNRPNGWLERALERPGLASAARAHYVAGPEIGALVVEVRALDNQTDRAVSQVVGLFERLSTGGVTEKDCRLARPAFASARLEATLHPLTRLAELYANRPWGSTPNLRALHDFLPLLRRNQLSVVVVSPDP